MIQERERVVRSMARAKRKTMGELQGEFIHKWCNRVPALESVGYLSSENKSGPAKYMRCAWRVVAVHLSIAGHDGAMVPVVLLADTMPEGSEGWGNNKHKYGWVTRAVKEAIPTHVTCIEVPADAIGSGDWKQLGATGGDENDEEILRIVLARSMKHWVTGRDEGKIKNARANRYWLMRAHVIELQNRAAMLNELMNALGNAGDMEKCQSLPIVQDMMMYRRAIGNSYWTDAEMGAAAAWSNKFQEVNEKRVEKHGAFGRRTRQQRLDAWRARAQAGEKSVREEREAKERELWTDEYIAGRVEEWKAGGTVEISNVPMWVRDKISAMPTMLRIRDGQVQTSRGAVIGMRAARRLWELAKTVWGAGVGEKEFGMQIGPYQLYSITGEEIRIGCHVLTRAVVEEFEPRFLAEWEKCRELVRNNESEE